MRRLTGSFGTVEIAVPRAQIGGAGGGTAEWKGKALPRYARMTKQVEALIAGTNLAGTNPGGCAGGESEAAWRALLDDLIARHPSFFRQVLMNVVP